MHIRLTFVTLLLCLTPLLSSANTDLPCNDILYAGFGNEYIDIPIEDCDNPFNAEAGFPYLAELAGQTISDGAEIVVPEGSTTTISVNAQNGEDLLPFEYAQLFLHDGDNYRQIRVFRNPSAPESLINIGTYTLVMRYELVCVSQTWGDWLKSFFIKTAHAAVCGPGSPLEDIRNYTVTFTVVEAELEPEPAGASSVLFLPGIQASRLYRERIIGTEDRIWESTDNVDASDLGFDPQGVSIEDVYTRDVIDEFEVLFGLIGTVDIYKSLLGSFNQLESNGEIEGFLSFPYDWRYDVFHVATQEVAYPNNEVKRLKNEIERMAEESYTGQVTVVAHSNGGLVLKALLTTISDEEFIEKIDKVILVGTPQLGAPKAVASLLHGYDQGIPLTISAGTARSLALNFPGAYGLLPSDGYFSKAGTPTVFFDTSESTSQFRAQYGNAINTPEELEDFLLGNEGRGEARTIEEAATVNGTLLDKSKYQSIFLDSLTIPNGIEFYTVVGTGNETEIAFEYREFEERICTQETFTEVCETETFYKPVPILSLEGDGTVPAVSAEYDGIAHYVDLRGTSYDHKNLTEYDEILSFIESVILDEEITVNNTAPSYNEDQLLIGIHSPMEILVTDSNGNQTGIVGDEIFTNIPNSSYRELAGSKYVTIPKSTDVSVVFIGQSNGGATVTVDEFGAGGNSRKVVVPIPVVTASTLVTMSVNNNILSNVETDVDGDGIVDRVVTPDGEVVFGEEYTYDDLRNSIESLSLGPVKKKVLLVNVKIAENASTKIKKEEISKKLQSKALKRLRDKLDFYVRKNWLTSEDKETVEVIIKNIESI